MTRLLASLALTILLGACAVPTNVGMRAADGATIVLSPGQTASLANGGGLRYVRLVNDSRCPPDVQCVWAGDAEIALNWVPANGPARDLELHFNAAAGPNHADLDGRRVTFTALSRSGAQASLLVTPVP
ncbi:MAG: hypothetical protein M3R16_10805 [Pseudomonadota bacterium]|nr:hypothetical protein [Pseudomonadota bacterium]